MSTLSETTAVGIAVAFGFTYIIGSAILGGLLTRLSTDKHLGIAVPPLMTTNPVRNWGALRFLYSVSPWRFNDLPATMLIYLVRLSVPLMLVFGGMAMLSR
ncbi:hypothetical protein [Vitreimonas flagellata]|uniref:hypothetical protein n=1 Tax=Vitreimonas flagellata TaxID=2560861 RepID=UPI0010758CA2|nr:hypothetical protein [Vitreimonas flagellata]